MSLQANKELVVRTWQAFIRNDLATALLHIAPDVRFIFNGELPGMSRLNQGTEFLRLLSDSGPKLFPGGVHLDIKSVHCEEDTVVLEYVITARTSSERPYSNNYCVFFRLRGETIIEIREYTDTQYIMETVLGPAVVSN